jgi:hypothetical protein
MSSLLTPQKRKLRQEEAKSLAQGHMGRKGWSPRLGSQAIAHTVRTSDQKVSICLKLINSLLGNQATWKYKG